jgi:hypothetical protein
MLFKNKTSCRETIMVDYDIFYLIELGFRQAITKRLSYKLGPLIVCPPCGPLGWYWAVSTDDLNQKIHQIVTPKNKEAIENLLQIFNL